MVGIDEPRRISPAVFPHSFATMAAAGFSCRSLRAVENLTLFYNGV